MATALDGLRNVDMDGSHPAVVHRIALDSKTFPRIFNHYGINYKIEGRQAGQAGRLLRHLRGPGKDVTLD